MLEDASEPVVDVIRFVRRVLALTNNLELEEQLALEPVVGALEEFLVHIGELELELLEIVNSKDKHVTVLNRLHRETPDHVATLE